MITPRFALAVCLAGLLLAPSTKASADDRPGAFRLALGVDLVGYRVEAPVQQSVLGAYDRPLYGTRSEELRAGLVEPQLALELSGVVERFVLVGVTAAVQYFDPALHTEYAHTTWEQTAWTVVPWVEIALLPGEIARPFLRGGVGLAGAYATWSGDFGDYEQLTTQLQLSAMLGVHIFLARDVSLDPYVSVSYASGEQKQSVSPSSSLGAATAGLETTDLAIGIAIGAWLGP